MNEFDADVKFVLMGCAVGIRYEFGFVFNEESFCGDPYDALKFNSPKDAAEFAKKYKLSNMMIIDVIVGEEYWIDVN